MLVSFALMLVSFALMLVCFALMLVSFVLMLVSFVLMLVSFALMLVSFVLMLVCFALMLVCFVLMLVCFVLMLVCFALMLVCFALMLVCFVLMLVCFVLMLVCFALMLVCFALMLVCFALMLVCFALMLVCFALMLVSFVLMLVCFVLMLVCFALMLVSFALMLVSFALMLVSFALMLVSFVLMLVSFVLMLVSFVLMLVCFVLMLISFVLMLISFVYLYPPNAIFNNQRIFFYNNLRIFMPTLRYCRVLFKLKFMHTQISLRFWLLIVATVLGVAACTAKLQRSTQPNQATASNTPQTAQSAKANEKIDTTLTLEKLRRTDYPAFYRAPNEYYLDTAITNHLPHFNAQELLTYYRFLFDLGKEDSMYCPRCNDSSYINYKGGVSYNYEYYYKGLRVNGGYIGLQTNYGDDKIYRVTVGYKRLKDFDVTPRMTLEEAAQRVGHAFDTESGTFVTENSYCIKNPKKYYMGLRINNNRLYHQFTFLNWGVYVYDIDGEAFARRRGVELCETCNFSTASYTTQTVPIYSNANFAWWVITLFIKNAPPMFYFLADKIQGI